MSNKMRKASGKGDYAHCEENDFLIIKTLGRIYSKSIEVDDLVLDIDTKGFITGMRIFDATKILKVTKEVLHNIQRFSFHAKVQDGVITVHFQFTAALQKEPVTQEHNFVHRVLDMKMQNSEVLCTVA